MRSASLLAVCLCYESRLDPCTFRAAGGRLHNLVMCSLAALLLQMLIRERQTLRTRSALTSLKYEDPRFENASVEFDEVALAPTYRLLWVSLLADWCHHPTPSHHEACYRLP